MITRNKILYFKIYIYIYIIKRRLELIILEIFLILDNSSISDRAFFHTIHFHAQLISIINYKVLKIKRSLIVLHHAIFFDDDD